MGSIVSFPTLFDEVFNDVFGSGSFRNYESGSRGTYHFVEDTDGTTLYVSAPGYKADDLAVEMHEGRLTITGKPSVERSLGVLVPKQINLCLSVNSSYLVDNAEFSDGLLTIRLVKPNKTEALRIPIQTK